MENLGSDILIGEPGKAKNRIVTVPHAKKIIVEDSQGYKVFEYWQKEDKQLDYAVCRIQGDENQEPNFVKVKVPDSMANKWLAFASKRDSVTSGFYKADEKAVIKVASEGNAQRIRRNDIIGEVRATYSVDIKTTPSASPLDGDLELSEVKQVHTELPEKMVYVNTEYKPPDRNHADDVIIDPDNQLTPEWRKKFRDLCYEFPDVLDPKPGRYNGAFGWLENSLDFVSKPPSNSRVHMPAYSENMKKIMAQKMDQLQDWGIIDFPEKFGIQVEFVSPSLLVPKDGGKDWRFVTDFTALNKYIRKYPAVSPGIAEAKSALSRKRLHVHLDFSNWFFQAGVRREDMPFLGIVHPYKGTMVYTGSAQGCKNSGELNYDKIGRMFGDMLEHDGAARMADGLHGLGDEPQELFDNFKEILTRARMAGLTFKPSKIVIAPKKTQLFGWNLNGSEWSPTEHTLSSLAKAERPTTVKGLRSYLGSFKQLSQCIPEYAYLLKPMEDMVGGKLSAEKLSWTNDQIQAFNRSKEAAADPKGVHIPLPNDIIHTWSDFSCEKMAIGGRMTMIRKMPGGEEKTLLGGFFSATLDQAKSRWLACEGEALAAKAVLEHFEPFIINNKNTVVHHTDSLPVQAAWKRARQGAFSTSSRIAAFLATIARFDVEFVHTPGKLLFTADYQSRNPVQCKQPGCQVCKFMSEWTKKGDICHAVRTLSVDDVMSGRLAMPFNQKKTWHDLQCNDRCHIILKNLIKTGQLPEKKRTKGDFTRLKLLHNSYCRGDLKVDKDDMVMVKAKAGNHDVWAISVPHAIFPGLAMAMHLRFNHASKSQLTQLMSRYFYTPGFAQTISDLIDECSQCKSVKTLPKVLLQDTTTIPNGFATNFAADVIERAGQRVLVVTESLTGWIEARLIDNQTADSIGTALFSCITPFLAESGTNVRTDGATAFQSLAAEAAQSSSVWAKHNIKIEIGRAMNVNKNPEAENKIKELEREVLKLKMTRMPISAIDLATVVRIMNLKPRHNSKSARELVLGRMIANNEPLVIDDESQTAQLAASRTASHQHSLKSRAKTSKATPSQQFAQGDLVFVRNDLDKHSQREPYVVVNDVLNSDGLIKIKKIASQLRAKDYWIHPDQLIHLSNFRHDKETMDKIPQTNTERRILDPGTSDSSNVPPRNSSNQENLDPQQPQDDLPGLQLGDPSNPRTAGKGKTSSNAYTTSRAGRPRRQAALNAHSAWIRALSDLPPARHGWRMEDQEAVSDYILLLSYDVITQITPNNINAENERPIINVASPPQHKAPQPSPRNLSVVSRSEQSENQRQPSPTPGVIVENKRSARLSGKEALNYRSLHSRGRQ